jgi:hypothetical protein
MESGDGVQSRAALYARPGSEVAREARRAGRASDADRRHGPGRFIALTDSIGADLLFENDAMLSDPKHEERLDQLTKRLRLAAAVTSDLISDVIADSCIRVQVLRRAGKTARIDHLIEAGAWSDVALALIELELPAWKLRRLVYEDGEWFCSLSKQPHLPVTLDDTADAVHDVLPLAMLSAFIEARRVSSVARETSAPNVPQVRPATANAICCDNFA